MVNLDLLLQIKLCAVGGAGFVWGNSKSGELVTPVYAPFLLLFVHTDLARVKLQTMRNCTTTAQLAIKEKCYNWLIRICFLEF